MKIFLSYRRADSQATAGRMAQFLDAVPAVDEVFLDVDGIQVGENFETRIGHTLGQATHVFLLIGTDWRGESADGGQARIFQADDMVRQETRMALRSNAKVVPVLLDAATMPSAKALPADLAGLSKLNAFSLRTAQFDEDMDTLLDNLVHGRRGRSSRWRLARLTPIGIAGRAIAGVAVGAAALIGLGVANHYADNGCADLVCTLQASLAIDDTGDALGLLWVIAITVLAIGSMAPFVSRLRRKKA